MPAGTVCVLGAGVIGLTTALRTRQELPHLSVTLVAEDFGVNTTSQGSGGLWEPYKLSDTPEALINRWGEATFHFLADLFNSHEAEASGVQMAASYILYTKPPEGPEPAWKHLVPHFRTLSQVELKRLSTRHALFVSGYCFETAICEMKCFMPFLLDRVLTSGVAIRRQKVTRLEDLAEYDAVVNCMGLRGATLFGDDSCYPIRGQVLRAKASWIKHHYVVDERFYVIPNNDVVVIGGTQQVGDWDLRARESDTQQILEGCRKFLPSLTSASIQEPWVGLRPGRKSVRLESELVKIAGKDRGLPVVHNYGHGGSGVTLCWGCAIHAVELLKKLDIARSRSRL
ncbi:hypothetical protein WJX74_008635 [Apatococcus lobatus]|uniref:FAD dependent oxidoreductase domain-containing protein n=1 Tax=Apatococcus lobatus TaxID=904363 RepID=A0AAW1RFH9_9CHLO